MVPNSWSRTHETGTGRPDALSVIDAEKYIQHNPQTWAGRDSLAALFARLAKTSPRVNTAHAFADQDFVFGHTEYDFATRRIGFEPKCLERQFTVAHLDTIETVGPPEKWKHQNGRFR